MLRIAAAQTPGTRIEQWPETWALIGRMIARAAQSRADVVVLPECVWPAYFLRSRGDYFRARVAGMPGGQAFVEQLIGWARAHRVAVCAGYVAEQEQRLFNAAVLIDAAGTVLGTHRKCFLWDSDHTLFEPGASIIPVSTPWAPVGLMICADARLPEIPATLIARGARLILQPTAWVNCGTSEKPWNPQPELLIPERAREFGVPVASASKWGVEGETTFVGSSVICDASGRVVAQCGTGETDLIVAAVRPGTGDRTQLASHLRTRLLSAQPAELPAARVPPLRIAYLRDRSALNAVVAAHMTRGRPRADAVVLVLLPQAVSGSESANAMRGERWLALAGPGGEVQDLSGVRVAAVADSDALVFGPIRASALAGAHVVVVFGQNTTPRTLRTRAAENRTFLVHVTSAGITAYDPCGQPVRAATTEAHAAYNGPGGEQLVLDVAQAADKEFAPGTNPFTARRPELYEF